MDTLHDQEEKILIVDDETDIREGLKGFFRTKGYGTLEASTGEQALWLVQTKNPQAVLLDLFLPGMDGISVLKKIREINPTLPVVMITGFKDEHIAKEAITAGASGYVVKPFDLRYLELVVLTRLVLASQANLPAA